VLGADLIASWQSGAGKYPDELVSALVERALNPRVLASWAAREALVARGDNLAVQALLSGIGYAAVGAVLALNASTCRIAGSSGSGT
jgi:hypothetical protein